MRPLLLFLPLLACNPDNEIKQVDSEDDGVNGGPQIVVSPDELYFDTLDVGSTQDMSFVVTNAGDEDLVVDSMYLAGSTAFSLKSDTVAYTLSPAQSIEFVTSYSPLGPEERSQLHIFSNDVGNPEALVDLEGTGRFPELRITPNPLDFGDVLLGCSRTIPLTLTNTGEAELTVGAIAEIGANFTLDVPFSVPATIAAGESRDVNLTFAPELEASYDAELVVTSDDIVSTQTAAQEGAGTTDSSVEDEFYQGDGPWEMTDIMFYVDQSGSMRDDQRRITDNFEDFSQQLADLNMDWQIMVVTKDNGCHNGPILTPETGSLTTEFVDAIDGRGGNYTEAGLTVALNAMEGTVTGGCNQGFIREGSKTVLVLVSDEVEQSSQQPTYYVNHIRDYAETATITAVAGDIPSGCDTAEAGWGYYEATQQTGGAFLSICTGDWTAYFQTIANLAATGQVDTFYLSSTPVEATLQVWDDDDNDVRTPAVAVDPGAWRYDADKNAIVFESAYVPEPGAHIVVNYELSSDCDT